MEPIEHCNSRSRAGSALPMFASGHEMLESSVHRGEPSCDAGEGSDSGKAKLDNCRHPEESWAGFVRRVGLCCSESEHQGFDGKWNTHFLSSTVDSLKDCCYCPWKNRWIKKNSMHGRQKGHWEICPANILKNSEKALELLANLPERGWASLDEPLQLLKWVATHGHKIGVPIPEPNPPTWFEAMELPKAKVGPRSFKTVLRGGAGIIIDELDSIEKLLTEAARKPRGTQDVAELLCDLCRGNAARVKGKDGDSYLRKFGWLDERLRANDLACGRPYAALMKHLKREECSEEVRIAYVVDCIKELNLIDPHLKGDLAAVNVWQDLAKSVAAAWRGKSEAWRAARRKPRPTRKRGRQAHEEAGGDILPALRSRKSSSHSELAISSSLEGT